MTEITVTPAPASPTQRLQALDATRGIAVLGILLMNIWAFAGPQAFFDYPLALAGQGGAPLATWAVVHTLFEGSQRALFSLLFGAGMILMVSRLEASDPPVSAGGIYYRRIGLLILIGLFDSFVLMWPADILLTYGLCGLALFPLRRLSARMLLLAGIGVLAALAMLRTLDWQSDIEARETYRQVVSGEISTTPLPPPVQAQVDDWTRVLERSQPDIGSPKALESMRVMREGSFAELYVERAKSGLILQTVVMFNSWLLDALGTMLIGMALFRSGILAMTATPATYLRIAMVGFAVGLPLSIWETTTLAASGFDPILRARHLIHYDLRRIAIGLGYLGSILWICQAVPGHWLLRQLAAVGRMALSNYLGQSIICGLIFYSIGLGLYGRFTGYYLYVVVLVVWVLQILFSNWWLSRFRFGPAEWLWRSLSYRRRQPLTLQ